MEWKKCRPIIPGHEVEKKEVAWKGGALEVERFFISKFRIKMDLISSLLFSLLYRIYLSIYQWRLNLGFGNYWWNSFLLSWSDRILYLFQEFLSDMTELISPWNLSFFIAFFWLLTYTSLVGFGCQFQILNQNWSIEVLKLEVEAWVQS